MSKEKISNIVLVLCLMAISAGVAWNLAPNEKVIYKDRIKEVEKPIEVPRSRVDESTDACKKKGGVPTYSAWNGELNGCIGIGG